MLRPRGRYGNIWNNYSLPLLSFKNLQLVHATDKSFEGSSGSSLVAEFQPCLNALLIDRRWMDLFVKCSNPCLLCHLQQLTQKQHKQQQHNTIKQSLRHQAAVWILKGDRHCLVPCSQMSLPWEGMDLKLQVASCKCNCGSVRNVLVLQLQLLAWKLSLSLSRAGGVVCDRTPLPQRWTGPTLPGAGEECSGELLWCDNGNHGQGHDQLKQLKGWSCLKLMQFLLK